MRIGVIGGGISGNTCAWLLSRHHDVELFESEPQAGGHTRSVEVELEGRQVVADTGFMVYNERTYPNFCRILAELGIVGQMSDMSFSVRCSPSGLEYQGSSLNGLFAQRSNLLSWRFHKMLLDIVRFNREALQWLKQSEELTVSAASDRTLGEYLRDAGYGIAFIEQYLVPMGAAIWSSRPEDFLAFPIRFLIRFLANHGLLQLRDRPQWLTIPQGARRYVAAMLRQVSGPVHLGRPVTRVIRAAEGVDIELADGERRRVDRVVLALHADDALKVLDQPTRAEERILNKFTYQENWAVLHTDPLALPRSRRAWASWNYFIPSTSGRPVSVTYDLNRLQRLGLRRPLCLTLNPPEDLQADMILSSWAFRHPVFDQQTYAAQAERPVIQGQHSTYFCGAYWGFGFHEDGVRSALDVVHSLGIELEPCLPASISAPSLIGVEGR